MIVSYSDLMIQVQRLMHGDDVRLGSIAVATMQQVISLAERRIYREVRSRYNEKAFSGVTVTSNLAPLPADFEAASIVHFGAESLEPVSEDWLRAYNEAGATGEARYFAEAGTSLTFGPSVANGTAVQGRYFYRIADLTAANFGSNTLIAREPDLFIYACLVEGVPFFRRGDGDMPFWDAKYREIVARLNADKNRTAYSAGRIKRRPSTILMG